MNVVNEFKLEWDLDKSRSIKLEGNKVVYEAGCDTNKYILSKQPLPIVNTYIEIERHHTQGCYDSIGLCTKRDA